MLTTVSYSPRRPRKLVKIAPNTMKRATFQSKFRCDNCNHTFMGTEVLAVPALNNMVIHSMGTMVSFNQFGKEWYLACPHCRKIAFFGFNKVS